MKKILLTTVCSLITLSLSAGVFRLNDIPDCRNTAFWSKVKSHRQYAKMMKDADKMAAVNPPSPLPLYLECSRTGNRVNYERRYFQLRLLGPLVTAYCTTGNVKYLKNIEARIRTLLSLPTWVLPAHDRDLKAYKGISVKVDLFSANMGAELATTLYILEPVLDKQLAADLRKALFHHVITPIENVLNGTSPSSDLWWLNGSNNWNPICKYGVIVTCLRIGMEKERIDKIIKLFFDNFETYMESFGNEGYCDEGMGYWGGSCGQYLQLAALLKLYDNRDVLSNEPRMLKAIFYPENIMMAPGTFPAYTDCNIASNPSMRIFQLRDILLNKRKGFSDDLEFNGSIVAICQRLNYPIDNTPIELKNSAPYSKFTDAGAFVVRQQPGSPLSVSFKGGSNRESHNHNDVGTYVIAVDGVPLVIDPGNEIYSARTFSPRRYESKLLNSYGHSVPKIAGQLQTNMHGKPMENPPENLTPVELIKGVLLNHDFSANYCTAKFDISRVYNHISQLKKLERTFVFDRKNNGSFTVTDEAEFSTPTEFEDAVITLSNIKELGNHKYLITWQPDTAALPEALKRWKNQSLLLEVKSSVPYKFSIDTINENTWHKLPVYRMTFTAGEKVKKIKMEFIFTPATK
ncbi:MAG: heparinase II/III family protein [Lentisphaeria bacterium]|nr:heparinase II/III family protein [Lentisphaeria bacterium]